MFTRGVDDVAFQLTDPRSSHFASASGYEVLDAEGRVVVTGGAVRHSLVLGRAATWRLGWYRLRLVGPIVDPAYGNAYGGISFVVVDASPHLPAVPSQDTPPSAIDVLGDGQDFVMHGLLDAGCARLSISDAANPVSQALGFRRNVVFDRSWWESPAYADPVRPHENFVAFPNGALTSAQLDGVTETVRQMYPEVIWYEGPINEPDDVMPAAQCAAAMHAFAAAVKRGNPGAKVLGPGCVTVNASATAYWEAFFAAGGGTALDGVSTHLYNCFLGDAWLGDATMAPFVAMLERHGVAQLPRWNTEGGGDLLTDYGSYRGRRQLHWSIVRLLQQERYGFTKERAYYFYDASHGFWDQPSWLEGQQPGQQASDLQPIAAAMRTLSGALRGTRFASELAFGPGSETLRAYVFRGASSTAVALFAAGSSALPVSLAVAGTASAVDVFGNPVATRRTGNVIELTIDELPTYVLLGPGASVGPVDVGTGLIRAGADLARDAKPVTNGSSGGLSKVTSGRQFSSYLDNEDLGPGSPWYDDTATFPALLTLVWRAPKRVRRAVLYFAPPWHQCTAPVRFRLETLDEGSTTWTARYSFVNHTATSEPFADIVTGCTRETFYDESWVFNILLPDTVVTRSVRIVVDETTYGGDPDFGTYALCAGNQGGVRRLFVRSFQVYES